MLFFAQWGSWSIASIQTTRTRTLRSFGMRRRWRRPSSSSSSSSHLACTIHGACCAAKHGTGTDIRVDKVYVRRNILMKDTAYVPNRAETQSLRQRGEWCVVKLVHSAPTLLSTLAPHFRVGGMRCTFAFILHSLNVFPNLSLHFQLRKV